MAWIVSYDRLSGFCDDCLKGIAQDKCAITEDKIRRPERIADCMRREK